VVGPSPVRLGTAPAHRVAHMGVASFVAHSRSPCAVRARSAQDMVRRDQTYAVRIRHDSRAACAWLLPDAARVWYLLRTMNRSLKPGIHALFLLSCLAVGCGDGDASEGNGGDNNDDTGKPSNSLREKLESCPLVMTSSDPTASACLVGTYQGQTLTGEACSLTVGQANTYTFAGPGLAVSYTPPEDVLLLFSHTSVGDNSQVIWKVGDPVDTETWYELDFTARFGGQHATNGIEIEVRQRPENNAVTCIVPL
jgi:hypothetical protein